MARNKKQPIGLGRWILILICLIVFVACAYQVLSYVLDKMHAENEFKEIRENARDLSELYEQNHDLIGWVQIKDTKIDYPVMQTPTDPEFYLHMDFNGEYSASGTPFLDAASVVLPRPITADDQVYGQYYDESASEPQMLTPTWNWLIYGHNMKIGTMFAGLQNYDDQEFWEGHKTFTFDVYDPATGTTDNGVYEIFAVSRSKIRTDDSNAFKYYQYAGYIDEATFQEFVAGVKAESSYDTGVTPVFGDQIVTLSTCAYHTNEGRFYICGRRIK